ncbi:Uncharacterised protein [Yersinia frederiksenii]|nr:Uncharacterised protein [Yersinia frederiksenii]CNI85925.1 Uncharacterised protein [Yersinia frederiksenii]CNK99608.1 Uncharacterised protein [Yersinia frederiksenii]
MSHGWLLNSDIEKKIIISIPDVEKLFLAPEP